MARIVRARDGGGKAAGRPTVSDARQRAGRGAAQPLAGAAMDEHLALLEDICAEVSGRRFRR